MSEIFVELFIAGRDTPKSVVLDIDATDDPTHGQQQLTFFRAHHDHHCYLPLIVTARVDGGPDELLATVLRPGNAHASHGPVAVIKRIVERLRAAWPEVQIVLRADGGFAKPEVYDWCEAAGVRYLIGLPTNSRLRKLAEPHLQAARVEHEVTGDEVQRLHDVGYAAGSWRRLRSARCNATCSGRGGRVRETTRRVWLQLASSCRVRWLWPRVLARIRA